MNRQLSKQRLSIRRQIRWGVTVIVLLFGGVGSWAIATEISGAVIAAGSIAVDSNVKKIQHPTGGIVGEIRVRDGDRVQVGDVLVRLDDTLMRANLGVVTKALDELSARRARLEAERDGLTEPLFSVALLARVSNPDVANAVASERKLFEMRAASRVGQKAQLSQRIEQLKKEIAGLAAQESAKARESMFVARELTGARSLSEKGLIPISKLTMLERDAARLEGERAVITATIARTRGKIAETELQILQIGHDLSSEVAKELREADARFGELVERKVAAEDHMRRVEIRAPQGGVIQDLAVHTVGGVASAGEVLMLIVPESDKLVVEARLAPHDVDQVFPGQRVMLRFSAFNQRTTPEIAGTLRHVSADVNRDQRTDAPYYSVRISVDPDQLAALGDIRLVPGMPVEVFAKTADRRVASYLVKPLLDQVTRAFREE